MSDFDYTTNVHPANADRAPSLIGRLESATRGTQELDEDIIAMLPPQPAPDPTLTPTSDINHTFRIIPPACWWNVGIRKNMPGFDFPNPNNGRMTFMAKVGLHSRDSGPGAKKGATGYGNTAPLALCAALINALKIELNRI